MVRRYLDLVKLSVSQNKTIGTRETGMVSMTNDKRLLPQEEGLLQTYKTHLWKDKATRAKQEMAVTQKQCVPSGDIRGLKAMFCTRME